MSLFASETRSEELSGSRAPNEVSKVDPMYGLIREEGSFGANPGSKDIARHLYTRMYAGKVVIVAAKPAALIGPLRKQWLKLMRSVQKERAKTLDASRVQELSGRVARMQSLRFTASWHGGDVDFTDQYDVYIATVDQLLGWPPDYRTMYVTCNIEREQLHLITTWMPKGSLVVICKVVA
jgi:hypothetical protein